MNTGECVINGRGWGQSFPGKLAGGGASVEEANQLWSGTGGGRGTDVREEGRGQKLERRIC